MHYHIHRRDGPARTGNLQTNKYTITTPNILYVHTDRFKAPSYAQILLTNQKTTKPHLQITSDLFLKPQNNNPHNVTTNLLIPGILPKEIITSTTTKQTKSIYEIIPTNKDILDNLTKNKETLIYIITYASQLYNQPKKFVDFILDLRQKIGYQKTIYLPGIGNPNNLAFLTYLGIDFLDSLSTITAARNKKLHFPTGTIDLQDIQELPCSCPICNTFKDKPEKMNFQQILQHNQYIYQNELKFVKNTLQKATLRNLVETRITSNPTLTAMLKYLNQKHNEFLEKHTPITQNNTILATTKLAMNRPEITRFQKRILTRYKKPENAKILLLLPCSAKKPYSYSKSHKKFKDQLLAQKNPWIVHELIITSPLGLVPRELETMYPACCYDIPVTGIWDEDEKTMITKLLTEYLSNNHYKQVIVHLPPEMQEFICSHITKPIITCTEKPTSNESLQQLLETLNKTTENYKKIEYTQKNLNDMLARTSYQFGIKTAQQLLKDSFIKGRYPNQKIIQKNKQIGMFTQPRGLLSLTEHGAKILSQTKKYWVEIHADFTLKGSVFSPGIKQTADEIRIGDEVVILQRQKPIAVGVAQMNNEEMVESDYGEAVKIRHRF